MSPTLIPRGGALGVLALGALLAGPARAQERALDAIDARVTPVVEVVQRARPAVVYIRSNVPSQRRDLWGRLFPDTQTTGSGAVIYEDGYIVTNYHVVRGANHITVSFDAADDSTVYEARLVSHVVEEDLALLKIDGDHPFPTIPLGSEDPILGETVIAIGNPYGQTHTVSSGIISGLHRNISASNLTFENLIQTDASINPGNSGGPLLNIEGDLIGINTAMNTAAENIGFAIPVARIRKVLMEYLTEANSWLGFTIDPASFTVAQVTDGGPAEQAGLLVGDRVAAIGGRRIESDEDYNRARLAVQPGDRVEVLVSRDGRERDLALVAWNRLDGLVMEHTGMTVERIVLGDRFSPHLQVASVHPGGPAALSRMQPGDLIATVQPQGWRPKQVRSIEDLAWLLSRLEPGTPMQVEIWRDEDKDGAYERDSTYSELFRGTLRVR